MEWYRQFRSPAVTKVSQRRCGRVTVPKTGSYEQKVPGFFSRSKAGQWELLEW